MRAKMKATCRIESPNVCYGPERESQIQTKRLIQTKWQTESGQRRGCKGRGASLGRKKKQASSRSSSAREMRALNSVLIIILAVIVACLLEATAMRGEQEDETSVEQQREAAKMALKKGQPELFSSESTGLGDLEASDALKKVSKRSIVAPGDQYAGFNRLIDRLDASRWRAQVKEDRLRRMKQGDRDGMLEKLASLERPAALRLFTMNNEQFIDSDQLRPISLVRRTRLGSGEQVEKAEMERQLERNEAPLLGEFGSRVSLLTTRKAQPARLFVRAGEEADELAGLSTIPLQSSRFLIGAPIDIVDAAQMKSGIKENQAEALNGLNLADLNSNSLPRVARAMKHKL